MRPTLERFIRALRASEVPVSVREGLEAHEVAALVGPGNREVLRHALAVTMAKTEDEKQRFEACFERFFARERVDQAALEAFAEQASGDPAGEPGEAAGEAVPLASLPLAPNRPI